MKIEKSEEDVMDRKKRIEYLITTMCVLISGFLMYGLVGSMEPLIDNSKVKSFLLFGLLGGFGFSMIVSTIILSARFFAKKKLGFKIVAAILWPITFACSFYAGFFIYIPYQIYNVIKIFSDSKSVKNKINEKIEELSLEKRGWKYVITGTDGNVTLFDVNIFEYQWQNTGEKIEVLDPLYKKPHTMCVYRVLIGETEHEFAAGEISNCVWGFYTRE